MVFIECLLCAKHCQRCQRNSNKQNQQKYLLSWIILQYISNQDGKKQILICHNQTQLTTLLYRTNCYWVISLESIIYATVCLPYNGKQPLSSMSQLQTFPPHNDLRHHLAQLYHLHMNPTLVLPHQPSATEQQYITLPHHSIFSCTKSTRHYTKQFKKPKSCSMKAPFKYHCKYHCKYVILSLKLMNII